MKQEVAILVVLVVVHAFSLSVTAVSLCLAQNPTLPGYRTALPPTAKKKRIFQRYGTFYRDKIKLSVYEVIYLDSEKEREREAVVVLQREQKRRGIEVGKGATVRR